MVLGVKASFWYICICTFIFPCVPVLNHPNIFNFAEFFKRLSKIIFLETFMANDEKPWIWWIVIFWSWIGRVVRISFPVIGHFATEGPLQGNAKRRRQVGTWMNLKPKLYRLNRTVWIFSLFYYFIIRLLQCKKPTNPTFPHKIINVVNQLFRSDSRLC